VFAGAFTNAAAAIAQPWPSHAVRIIATSPPGGSVDFLARTLAEDFGRSYGFPFVVENRPGANGNIGVDLVTKAPADGHTMFVSPPGPFSINVHLMPSMPFDPARDLAPVTMLAVAPLLLVVHPSVPAASLPELLAWLRTIGVAELKRIRAAPDVPTLDESGLPGFDATTWLGMRAGTPAEIVSRLAVRSARALAEAQAAKRMTSLGIEPRPMTPEEFAAFLRADSAKWADIIRRSGVKLE
jgi:tripartite-type tricarboxylate transporter receptor subunit TctC